MISLPHSVGTQSDSNPYPHTRELLNINVNILPQLGASIPNYLISSGIPTKIFILFSPVPRVLDRIQPIILFHHPNIIC
jgi:hypothetical protein